MKKRLALILLLLFFGCSTAPQLKTACPSEAVYIPITVRGVSMPLKVKKGFFDDCKNCKNQKEFDEWEEKQDGIKF